MKIPSYTFTFHIFDYKVFPTLFGCTIDPGSHHFQFEQVRSLPSSNPSRPPSVRRRDALIADLHSRLDSLYPSPATAEIKKLSVPGTSVLELWLSPRLICPDISRDLRPRTSPFPPIPLSYLQPSLTPMITARRRCIRHCSVAAVISDYNWG
ncbi:hypothetical protein CRG98_019393 [Punica granatum]|uniref:Uncharacterized protein n=1 Tax=Punica granatum TaxID=22663 RepID=A0A2I0JV96_PUNGR|nr:hypothetical protein CRG98_019393 [Punica granatum]